jgi:hypothetical protein
MNRFLRRMQRFGKGRSGRAPRDEIQQQQPPPAPDPRAKNSGHGKKTADKWNQ